MNKALQIQDKEMEIGLVSHSFSQMNACSFQLIGRPKPWRLARSVFCLTQISTQFGYSLTSKVWIGHFQRQAEKSFCFSAAAEEKGLNFFPKLDAVRSYLATLLPPHLH